MAAKEAQNAQVRFVFFEVDIGGKAVNMRIVVSLDKIVPYSPCDIIVKLSRDLSEAMGLSDLQSEVG
jgi:hypothetical protein